MKKADNFIYLLVAMLFLIVVSPMIDYFWHWPEFRPQGLIFAVTLLVAVFSIHDDRLVLTAGVALVLVTFVSAAIASSRPVGLWDYISSFSFFLYLVMALWICVIQLFQNFRISANKLVGAICIYMLLGFVWSSLYAGLYVIDPSAFSGVPEGVSFLSSDEWLYFSFVTLTTLGYGDIVPVSQTSRTLAFVQAIVGQFYLAILVAGLVSAYLADRRSKDAL
jgi:voltage-gated potassium channel